MYILAIESSCDETAMAILQNGRIIKNIISSQINVHKKYGGVVPEIASRLHESNFSIVIDQILDGIDVKKITHIAYTSEPGLIGCLQVGFLVAHAISQALNIPIFPINHLDGHVFASAINNKISYPFLALVVSGGHTQLVEFTTKSKKKIIGETQDDAVGEAYDKIGRKLGLKYPAGPQIDKLAQKGNANINFSVFDSNDSLNFSFSGLKSSVINFIHNLKQKNETIKINDICASFQKAAISILIKKTKQALEKKKYKTLVLAGGVSANSYLRSSFLKLHSNTIIPNLEYCTDNAAMIAKTLEIFLQDK